ncbi:protein translocase subunit SecF [candidate division KSB1 bacterium]
MEFIKRNINIDFLEKRKTAFYFSMILIIISFVSLVFHGGPKLGLDFRGGTQINLHFDTPESAADIRNALSIIDLGTSEIKEIGSENDILITVEQSTGIADTTVYILREAFPDNNIIINESDEVGSRIGSELKNKSIISVILALFFLIIYISWRFEFKFAIGAITALVHDVLITIGVFSVMDKEITLPIVAALLTIVGYSLNDTIVVSDRIRENIKVLRKEKYPFIINRSLNQTLSRTIITSFTTLLVVIILYLFGSEIIKDFALALIIGVSIGTYSSLFVATPIVVLYHDWQEEKKKIK